VACIGERRSAQFLGGSLSDRDHLDDLNIDHGIVLKWIFKKRDGEPWTGFIWLWIGTGERHWGMQYIP